VDLFHGISYVCSYIWTKMDLCILKDIGRHQGRHHKGEDVVRLATYRSPGGQLVMPIKQLQFISHFFNLKKVKLETTRKSCVC
jgi:hypothetical protein